jgi:uncharacterized membrane-anchored protein YjiN (DUF445 family)
MSGVNNTRPGPDGTGGGYLGGMTAPPPPPSPPWARPDDGVRQAQLDAMKLRATGLLALAVVVFAVASAFESRYPWLGYVRATAEASLVGGLADWFAVTALFRHPLGIPIPHTAIVATRKERIGRILGNFVQNHFLSREVIAANLRAVRPAERAARWLSDPEHSRQIARQVASGLAQTLQALPDAEVQELVHQVVSARLHATRVAPALGKTLALVLAGDRHQGLLNEAVRLAAEAVRDNREMIREQVRAESPWWVPGVVDDKIYQRIFGAIEGLLRDIGTDPEHPLRAAFDAALRDFVDRLQHSPDVIAKAEAMKEEWLSDPAVAGLSARLWDTVRGAIVTYATKDAGAAPGPLERGLSEFGTALLASDVLLAEIDDLAIDLTAKVVERYRHEIGDLIAQTVAGWDPDVTSRRFELAVGRDLQFVRINGTLVGGLVGLAIHTLTQLWH